MAIAKKTTTKKSFTKKTQKSTKGVAKVTEKPPKKLTIPAFFPKYPEYRLGDMISSTKYRDETRNHVKSLKEYFNQDETLKEYHLRMFPSSITSQYLRKTERTNDIDVLSNAVDDFMASHKIATPGDDVMVMHLRVGDVIDKTELEVEDFLNRRINSFHAVYGPMDTRGWAPVYVRSLESFDRALKKTEELGFHKISLVYGFHIRRNIDKSKQYLAALVEHAQSKGFEVELVTHVDADVSFAYACKAKHFVPGGGGFSKLMAKVVRKKGNSVYQVRV
jgi:hypothetical protein